MIDGNGGWARQSEAFWRAHHEAWKRSDLNQRQYCEAEDSPPLPGFSEDETAAACDIIANSEED